MSKTRENFYRPEYLPHDRSNLESVYRYLRSRVNFFLRSSIEYPAVLPLSERWSLFSTIAYLCQATAYYDEDRWNDLYDRICLLVEQRLGENRGIQFKIAQQMQQLLEIEESQEELSDDRVECLNASHQIDLIATRKRNLVKEVQWLEKMHLQLADPRLEKINKKKMKLQKFDESINQLVSLNTNSIKQLEWDLKKKENECILLEGEIEAIQSRINMIASTLPEELLDRGSYTTEELALLDYSSTTE